MSLFIIEVFHQIKMEAIKIFASTRTAKVGASTNSMYADQLDLKISKDPLAVVIPCLVHHRMTSNRR